LHENGQKKAEVNFKNGKRDGLYVGWHENGEKKAEKNYKNGKWDGLAVLWHENGQKRAEGKAKGGELVSEKFWNSKGEPVDTIEEANNNP